MTFTKTQIKILNIIQKLGGSLSSPAMLANDTGLKIQTVKRHLKSLEKMGAVIGTPCDFHKNTTVYDITKTAQLFLN